jgi:hypothetical protein
MATAELYIPPKAKPIQKKETKTFSDIFKSEIDISKDIEEFESMEKAWKLSISKLAGQNIVSLNHPQHGSITVIKQGDQFHVKHNGALVGIRGQKGIFNNAEDAMAHAKAYAQGVSTGSIRPQKMHNMPSAQSFGLQRPTIKTASKDPATPPMPTPTIKKSANTAPSQLVNQDALQKENLVSSIKKRANQAYKMFEKKEELLSHLKTKHPEISEPVLKSLVKMFALKREEELEKALMEISKK